MWSFHPSHSCRLVVSDLLSHQPLNIGSLICVSIFCILMWYNFLHIISWNSYSGLVNNYCCISAGYNNVLNKIQSLECPDTNLSVSLTYHLWSTFSFLSRRFSDHLNSCKIIFFQHYGAHISHLWQQILFIGRARVSHFC